MTRPIDLDDQPSSQHPRYRHFNAKEERDTIEFLKETSWIKSFLHDPSLRIVRPRQRGFNPDTLNDAFWAQHMVSSKAIRCIRLCKKEPNNSAFPYFSEAITLLALGPMTTGMAPTLHGGLTATVCDEIATTLMCANHDYDEEQNPARKDMVSVTLKMDLAFRKVVLVPGVVLGRARLENVDNRKLHICATIEGEDGTIMAEAKMLFLNFERINLGARGSKI